MECEQKAVVNHDEVEYPYTRWKSRGQAKTAAIHCFELNFAIMLVTALKAMKKLTRMMIVMMPRGKENRGPWRE